MWPFKKKKELKKEPRIIRINRLEQFCPRPDCICYSCPSRGKCSVEMDVMQSGACILDNPSAPRITECSLQKARKGEFDGTTKEKCTATRIRPGTVTLVDDPNDSDLRCFEEGPTVRG